MSPINQLIIGVIEIVKVAIVSVVCTFAFWGVVLMMFGGGV